ncbi:MAG: hypothetical protein Q4E62_09290 [Sutterellaceae bacterium]|nr:hypothetical protein [Sutterellaceae bacterium]
MARRKQKMSRAKSRTAWLAWLAWGIFGTIFVFEDTVGGSGLFAWIFTAPFWVMFAVWPFMWAYLKMRMTPEMVEVDDDIVVGETKCRLVQKDGVRYVERASFEAAFEQKLTEPTVKLAGGDEDFVELSKVEKYAKDNEKLKNWLAVVETLPIVR